MAGITTLVLGGVRSGKSSFAEELVGHWGGPALYVATGRALDEEMAARIRKHRERRPTHWLTLEEPFALPERLARFLQGNSQVCIVLVDSVDAWISNLILAQEEGDRETTERLALESLDAVLQLCADTAKRAVLVSSEVGLSPVSLNALGRQFQDLLGTINQRIASQADEVFLVVAGIPVRVKPGQSG